jgi:hypothetical protein
MFSEKPLLLLLERWPSGGMSWIKLKPEATLCGAEEQATCAISANGQCACLFSLKWGIKIS